MKKATTKPMTAGTALPARCAGGRLCPPERAAATATTVPTVSPACIWTWSRGTGRRTAAGVWVRKNGEWAVIHRCRRCGHLSSNRVAADDNPMKLMSIAMRPLSQPPFPLERIEEMTALMGGEGCLRGG